MCNYKASSKTKTNKLFHISNHRPPNCLIAKFHAKIKIFRSETKNAFFECFGQQFENLLSYLKSAPSNLLCCKVLCKKLKFLNLGPKIPDFRILGLEFENIIVIFYISVLEFGLSQSLVQKLKSLNLGPKYLISTSSNLPNCTISPKKQEL